jgi:N-methylhydantoinase B
MNIPSAGISDIERVEMQYPFLYFTRAHDGDGSGYGRYRGGFGSYRIYFIYGSQDCSADYKPYGGIAQGGFGLFGAYPTGRSTPRYLVLAGLKLLDRVRQGEYPDRQGMRDGKWGTVHHPQGVPERASLPEGSLLIDYVAGGGGFGDSLERDPEMVLRDYGRGWASQEAVEKMYGVVFDREGKAVDAGLTEQERKRIREVRYAKGRPHSGKTTSLEGETANGWRSIIQFHAVLDIAANGRTYAIRCTRCGHIFCGAEENYKLYALHQVVDLNDFMPDPLPSGEPYIGEYHEYYCPGCATQLQVDLYCPMLGGEPILWDTRIDLDRL